MKYIQRYYSLKLLTCALEEPKTALTHIECKNYIANVVSHWLFMHVMAGSLQ